MPTTFPLLPSPAGLAPVFGEAAGSEKGIPCC